MRWAILTVLLGGLVAAAVALRPRADAPLLESGPQDDISDALARVQSNPRDPAAWMALGDAQAATDALGAAEHAYRTAAEVGAGQGLAAARLGFLLYQQGRDAEARRWLEAAREQGASVPLLKETLQSLAQATARADAGVPSTLPEPAPSPLPPITDAGVGELDAAVEVPPPPAAVAELEASGCEIPVARSRNGSLMVDVVLNGLVAHLILDTGATMTVLNRSAADDVGAASQPGRLIAMTANGTTEMALGQLDDVAIGGRRVQGVRVAVCDECIGARADGLLGVDLQAAFDLQLDVAGPRLWFRGCE